jgi:hypothetical protein
MFFSAGHAAGHDLLVRWRFSISLFSVPVCLRSPRLFFALGGRGWYCFR